MMTPALQPELGEKAGRANTPRPARIGLRRYSAAEFLVALVLLIVVSPFVEDLRGGNLIEAILMTTVLTSGALAVGGRRKTLWVAVVLVCPAIVGKWLDHLRPNLVPPEFFLSAGLVFAVFIVTQFLRFILRTPRVNSEVLCAGLSAYLMLGLCWMFAYLIVSRINPDAFATNIGPASHGPMDNFTGFYFSFITLCTVGYGNIVPISNVARMLAVTEAMTGTLFVAVLISRLVSLYSSTDSSGATPPSNSKEQG